MSLLATVLSLLTLKNGFSAAVGSFLTVVVPKIVAWFKSAKATATADVAKVETVVKTDVAAVKAEAAKAEVDAKKL